jgi:hypothetical protein
MLVPKEPVPAAGPSQEELYVIQTILKLRAMVT